MRIVVAFAAAAAGLCASAAGGAYDWQKPNAKLLPNGDLGYAPEAWTAPKFSNARYIDFEGGDDAKDGKTPSTAWKRHPNDPLAQGQAKANAGKPDAYIFKRGVAYRGELRGELSNAALASLPTYGKGEAVVTGAEKVAPSAWRRGAAPGMPDADKVWSAKVDGPVRAVWCRAKGGKWTRLVLARTPNVRDPNWLDDKVDDVMEEWWTWEQPEWWSGKNVANINGHKAHVGIDSQHLKGFKASDLVGGLVWSEWGIVMGTPFASRIEAADPARGSITFQGFWYGDSEKIITKNRYFMEDRPVFLDAAGEFWFDRQGEDGTLYARFPGDADPSKMEVEVSRRCSGFDLSGLEGVRITALSFERIGPHWRLEARPFEDESIGGAGIRVRGTIKASRIDHCRFTDVNAGLRLRAERDDRTIDGLVVCDNEIEGADQIGMEISGSQRWGKNDGPYAYVGAVDVLRNRIHRTGMRPARSESGHSLSVSYVERLHLAGNFVSRTCGAGIFVFVGKPDGDKSDCPYARVMIHHNKVEDPLLMANDWGGIETWQGGPTYVWGNVSKNPGGYWNWAAKEGNQRLGFAYYLDGGNKNYHFDNIALGKSSDPKSKLCNGSALYQATPTILNAFYNGLYRTFAQGSGWNPQGGRHVFAGNRFEDISVKVFDHKAQKEDAGHDYGGAVLKESVFMVANGTPDAPQAHRRVKPFIPWSLARTVGEWNFRKGVEGLDEHWYMSPAMTGRFDYWKHPRNDLEMPAGVSAVKGGREDWVESCARFKGGEGAVLKGRAPVAAPKAAADAPRAAGGLKTVKSADWCEVTLPERPEFGKNLKAKIKLGAVPPDCVGKKLLFHWHWLKSGGWGGYISHVYVAPKVTGPGEYSVELVNIPGAAPAGIDQHSFLVGISPDDEIGHSLRRADFTLPASGAPAKAAAPVSPLAEFPMAVGRNSFIIEAVLATTAGGVVADARKDGVGFALAVAKSGQVGFRFATKNGGVTVPGTTAVNDGKFHHVLCEVDRKAGKANVYVDGKLSGSKPFAVGDADASTAADLVVGKGFSGDLDFLRIAHASLAESHTDIRELYAWEFAGPFLGGAK